MLLRYFAAARAAAGCAEETVELIEPVGLPGLRALLAARHPESASPSAPALKELLPRCSFLRNEVAVAESSGTDARFGNDDVVDVLPPFAGG